jgi:hypothetical protein
MLSNTVLVTPRNLTHSWFEADLKIVSEASGTELGLPITSSRTTIMLRAALDPSLTSNLRTKKSSMLSLATN